MAMPARPVELHIEGTTAWLALNRPGAGNAIDLQLARAFTEAAAQLVADAGVRVVMVRAEGRLFCAGGDLRAIVAAEDPRGYLQELAETFSEGIASLVESPVVVVSLVQGAAAGAGLALVASSDLVIAADTATFRGAYGLVGLTPDCGASYFLPRVIGSRRAGELLLTSRAITALEARDWALVNEVVGIDDLPARGVRLAAEFASGASGVLGTTKQQLRDWDPIAYRRHLKVEAETIAARVADPESMARIESFLRPR